MLLNPDERTALFIDGQNLYAAQRALGKDTDYASLLNYFRARCLMVSARYYTTYPDDKEFVTIRPLLDWLAFNGYNVTAKPRKIFPSPRADQRVKGNSLVDLAVDALSMSARLKHIVLFSGDDSLIPLIDALRADGNRVTVVSTQKSDQPVCSPELTKRPDEFVELDDFLLELTAKSAPPRPRPNK